MSGILKERREALGRDIREIAQVTRIKGSYLRSIEEEDYGKLPVEVYTRGYIKEYAEFLGIPSDTALNPYERYLENKRAAKGKEPVEKSSVFISAQESHDDLELIKKIISSESDETPFTSEEEPRKSILPGKIVWVFLLVVAAIGIYALIPRQESAPPPVPTPLQEQQAKAPGAQNPPVALNNPGEQAAKGRAETKGSNETAPMPPQGTPAKPDSNTAAKSPAASGNEKAPARGAEQKENTTAPKKHSLYIAAAGKSWIRVIIDGSEKREMMLNPGEKVNFGADKNIILKIGNAAGVALKYDGKEIKDLGGEGEVVNLSFPAVKTQQPAPDKKKDSGEGSNSRPEPTELKTSEPSVR